MRKVEKNNKITLICLVSLFFFLVVAFLVWIGATNEIDVFIRSEMDLLFNPMVFKAFTYITNLIGIPALIILGIFFMILIFIREKYYYFFLLVLGLFGGFVLEQGIKLVFQRVRPSHMLVVFGSSFPSGHATLAVILFGFIVLFFKDDIKEKFFHWFFISLCVLLIFAIGFSRIYLGVHWLSDVIGGFFLGLFWLSFLMLVLPRIKIKK